MIVAISYLLAVIITLLLAIILYPIAGFFWILGFFGRISEGLFKFTSNMISSLWRDIRKMSNQEAMNSVVSNNKVESWQCSCGHINNDGRFCEKCGQRK